MTTARELPATRTPCTSREMALAIRTAWAEVFPDDEVPTGETVALLLAQWALETGRGASMFCFNVGNVKSVPRDGRSWTFFRCNEVLKPASVERAIAAAQQRTDDVGLDAVRSKTDPRVVWFYPSNPAARFRAFDSLHAGVVDYLRLLHTRFAKAWPHVLAGDVPAFSRALRAMVYYTADETTYTAGLVSLAQEFSGVAAPPTVNVSTVLGLAAETVRDAASASTIRTR